MPVPPPLDAPADARALDRWYLLGLACMAVLVLGFPLYRWGEPTRREAARKAMIAENVALGREAFARHCAACHGDEGRGGRGMPTLASREFLGAATDGQLFSLVANGVPGTPMTAFDMELGGPFTRQEIERVVAYLRSLEARAPSVPGWRTGATR